MALSVLETFGWRILDGVFFQEVVLDCVGCEVSALLLPRRSYVGDAAIPVTEGTWRHPAAEGSAPTGGKRYVVDWICSSEQGDGLLCSVYRFSLAEIFVHMGQLC